VSGHSERERGQASTELVGLVLLVSLVFLTATAVSPVIDGRAMGGFLAHHLVCAATRGCHDAEEAMALAYGDELARVIREQAPNLVYEPGERELPVDWRQCRQPRCASAPDNPDLDAHVGAGRHVRASAFTHVIRRGGRLYLQYWLN
jgi:hypothetical protein